MCASNVLLFFFRSFLCFRCSFVLDILLFSFRSFVFISFFCFYFSENEGFRHYSAAGHRLCSCITDGKK